MFDPRELGTISPDEQADALRTLVAVFATSVVRQGREPRNAISAEIIDILDEVAPDQIEVVAQLFSMMALRLRRRGRGRHTAFRLAVETALLARTHAGGKPVQSEVDYLSARRPDLDMIDDACAELGARISAMRGTEAEKWLTARTIAAALIYADREYGRARRDRDAQDLGAAEFMMRTAAQYLAATSNRNGPPRRGDA